MEESPRIKHRESAITFDIWYVTEFCEIIFFIQFRILLKAPVLQYILSKGRVIWYLIQHVEFTSEETLSFSLIFFHTLVRVPNDFIWLLVSLAANLAHILAIFLFSITGTLDESLHEIPSLKQ